jgi:hypothetical protein
MQMEIIDGDFPAQTVKINKKGKHYNGAGFTVWGQDKKLWAYGLRNGLKSYEVLAEDKKKKTVKIVLRDEKVFIAVVEDNVLEAFKIAQALPPEKYATVTVQVKGKWLTRILRHKRLVTYSLLAWVMYSMISYINDSPDLPDRTPRTPAQIASAEKVRQIKEAQRAAERAEKDAKKAAEELEERIEDAQDSARVLCDRWVKERLSAPLSAKFGTPTLQNHTKVDGGTLYIYRNSVRSQNRFGVILENRFRCKAVYNGGEETLDPDNWTLVSVEFFDD